MIHQTKTEKAKFQKGNKAQKRKAKKRKKESKVGYLKKRAKLKGREDKCRSRCNKTQGR